MEGTLNDSAEDGWPGLAGGTPNISDGEADMGSGEPANAVAGRDDWARNSFLVDSRRHVEGSLLGRTRRRLTPAEIAALEARGNSAESWAFVGVSEDFHPEAIHHCRFEGEVHLGRFDAVRLPGQESAPGLFMSLIRDSHVGSGSRVANCGLVARTFVSPGAVLESVGRMTLRGASTRFGNDLELFHEELFSRRTRVAAEMPFGLVAAASGPPGAYPEFGPDPAALARELADLYAGRIESVQGYVGPGAVIQSVGVIENCWIGEEVRVEGATQLRNCTIWADPGESTTIGGGAVLERALVGPGCRVEGPCRVEDSILFDHVDVGPGAILKGAAVAANSRLAAGEAHDCLLGPYTMAIHQGTILSAWWPEGRGNISYGSNVGSNHTGRAPDQEIWPGEGQFFGLGCSVKFPCNFREAPYTLVASGVCLLPQRVSFPFSLITSPGRTMPGCSPALNEIRPGWGLLNNAYGIERQEWNHARRDRARTPLTRSEILRRELIETFARALEALTPPGGEIREFYTDRQIPAVGKNYLTEEGRREALEAYLFGRLAGAARILLRELDALSDRPSPKPNDGEAARAELIRWAAAALAAGDPVGNGPGVESGGGESTGGAGGSDPVGAALFHLGRWVGLVREARLRDERRGEAILPDYRARHVCVDRDPLVARCEENLRRLTENADRLRRAAERAAGT